MSQLNTVEVAFTESIPVEIVSLFPSDSELESMLQTAVHESLQAHDIASSEISIAIVGDEQIHEINRQYLNHDYETDVITFDLGNHPENDSLQGEIVVSAETAVRMAREYENDPATELVLYVVHGALHLSGFDDHSDEDRSAMRAAERAMMTKLGYSYKFELEEPFGQ